MERMQPVTLTRTSSLLYKDKYLKIEWNKSNQGVYREYTANMSMKLNHDGHVQGFGYKVERGDVDALEILVNKDLEKYYICSICGYPTELRSSMVSHQQIMRDNECCSLCAFWVNWEKIHLNPDEPWYQKLVIDGRHYLCSNAGLNLTDDPTLLGSKGSYYQIQSLVTGDIVETNDLWYQGDIPPHFKSRFPDNATVLQRNAQAIKYPPKISIKTSKELEDETF